MPRVLVTYSASRIALYAASLPLLSFVFCVLYSLVFSFKESTETHCNVANLLPSISAAIGNFAPQRYVWRIGLGIHSAPRYVYAWMYRSLHRTDLPAQYRYLADIAFVLEIIECTCLLGLTMVSSTENYLIHKRCFIAFLPAAIMYMCLCAFTLSKLQPRHGLYHRRSLAIKRKATWTALISSVICAITFYRHNSYCEPYMYTAFAFAEYLIVLSNIVFHGTAYYDFYGANIVVGCDDDDSTLLLKRKAMT